MGDLRSAPGHERGSEGVTENGQGRPRQCLAAVIMFGALLTLTVLSVWSIEPPDPRGPDAPPNEFSAARAFVYDERIATAPHVAGSSANDLVHEYLVSTLTGLGLRVETQDAIGKSPVKRSVAVAMAHVRNIVALLPGADSTGRVMLVAHYDSVQNGPGASDDGAGVSAILEVARALTASPDKPRNDIVFVLTDAEEPCLCGAEAFAGQHTLAAQGGVVLNLEARGAGGPVITFETSRGNRNLIDMLGAYAPWPVGTSFAVEVYRLLPNDTDFSVFRHSKENGGPEFTGLNAAYIDGSAVYHTSKDTAANLNWGSLQAHGDNALALARAFGAADLAGFKKPANGDATYFPVFKWLMRYPGWLVSPLATLALLGVLGVAWHARHHRVATIGGLFASFGLALVPIIVSAVLAQLLWALLVAIRPGYANMIDPWRPSWFRFAIIALVVAVITGWYAPLRRRFGAAALSIGALAWLALFGIIFAAVTPGGSYLTAIPALACAAAAEIGLGKTPAGAHVLALMVAGAITVLILAPTVMLFFFALGLARAYAPALFATLLGLALLPILDWLYPVIHDRRCKWISLRTATPSLTGVAVMLLSVLVGLGVDRFDRDHPQPVQLMYILDADTNTAYWGSGDSEIGGWTGKFVAGRAGISSVYPAIPFPMHTGDAQVARLPAPEVVVLSDTRVDDTRILNLHLTSKRAVRLTYFQVKGGARVLSATIAGRTLTPADIGDGRNFGVLFHAPPNDGLTIVLVLDAASAASVAIRAMDGSDGLAGLPGYSAPPDHTNPLGGHVSNLVLVAKTYPIP